MPYIFSAQEAGMLAAGIYDDGKARETQRLLTLIECAVRAACLQQKLSVALLAPDFRGWDKGNLSSMSLAAQDVLTTLQREGYRFRTNYTVNLASQYGEDLKVPYVHTVVTWPKIELKAPTLPPIKIFEDKTDTFSQELPDSFFEKDNKSVSYRDVDLTDVEQGDLALSESMNENLTPVCIRNRRNRCAEQETDLGADEAYFRESLPAAPSDRPKAGTPSQLLGQLYEEGYTLPGYNNDNERDGVLPPTSFAVCGIISGITAALETAHLKVIREVVCDVSKENLPSYDINHILLTFGNRGFVINYEEEHKEFRTGWNPQAWYKAPIVPATAPAPVLAPAPPAPWPAQPAVDTPPAPVQLEICGTEQDEENPLKTVGGLIYRLGKHSVKLSLTNKMKQPGFWVRASWDTPQETEVFRSVLQGVFDAAMMGETRFAASYSIDFRLGRVVEYFNEVGLRTVNFTEREGTGLVQSLTINWDFR